MDLTQSSEHWQQMYSTRQEQELSWFEDAPSISLELLLTSQLDKDAPVLDIGGGASRLADALLDRGFTQPTVLDISEAALEKSKLRLANRAPQVRWITADITRWEPDREYRAWHDRAVFHFFTEEEQRLAYRSALKSLDARRRRGHWHVRARWSGAMQRSSGQALLAGNSDCGTRPILFPRNRSHG